MPLMWPEAQVNGNRHQFQQHWQFDALHQPIWGREEDSHNLITPENSLLSYDSSANSGRLHASLFLYIFCQEKNKRMKETSVPHYLMTSAYLMNRKGTLITKACPPPPPTPTLRRK